MKITVKAVSRSLWQRMKVLAAQKNRTMGSLVSEGCRLVLAIYAPKEKSDD